VSPLKTLFLGKIYETPPGSLPWFNTALWTPSRYPNIGSDSLSQNIGSDSPSQNIGSDGASPWSGEKLVLTVLEGRF